MYYMTYGNNDYRDYVMAHSLGEWTKPVKYIAKKVVNGVTRYIYEPAKTGVQKHVTGSYYKNEMAKQDRVMRSARLAGGSTANRTYSKALAKKGQASMGYNRSLAGRVSSARSSIGKAISKLGNTRLWNGVKLSTAVNHYLGRGRALVNKVLERIPGTSRNKLKKQTDKWAKEHKGKTVSKQVENVKPQRAEYEIVRTPTGYYGNEKVEVKKKKNATPGYKKTKKITHY